MVSRMPPMSGAMQVLSREDNLSNKQFCSRILECVLTACPHASTQPLMGAMQKMRSRQRCQLRVAATRIAKFLLTAGLEKRRILLIESV